MPAKRCKKNAHLGLLGKIGAEWRWYGEKTPTQRRESNVGGAVRRFDLPPIAVCQLNRCWLTHCYRGQAPSHISFAVLLRSDQD